MAILLVQTSDHATVVHTDDPDVTAPPDRTGWVRLSELPPDAVGPGATRVTVRPLGAVEYLSVIGLPDAGQKAIETMRRAVVSVDGKQWGPDLEAMFSAWPWDILSSLHAFVRMVSEGPTRRRS